MKKQPRQYDDDDGRVICSMDAIGKPWYEFGSKNKDHAPVSSNQGTQMTRSESWRYSWYAVLAGLTVVAVFSVTWILFILFCINVWFK